MIVFVNDKILTTPFETNSVETQTNKGFSVVKQKSSMTELKVLEDVKLKNETSIEKGSFILVDGEDCKHPYANHVIDFNGVSAILVPFERVVAVRKDEPDGDQK